MINAASLAVSMPDEPAIAYRIVMAKASISTRHLLFMLVPYLYKNIFCFIRQRVVRHLFVSKSAPHEYKGTVKKYGKTDKKKSGLICLVIILLAISGKLTPETLNIIGHAHAGEKGLSVAEKGQQLESSSLLPRKGMDFTDENRFIDNADGTVTDRKTNLMWIKTGKPILGAITWKEADTFCEALTFAGYSDWRLPANEEWAGIIDTRYENPALPVFNLFSNVVTYLDYWSKTDHPIGPGYAWAVNLYYGKHTFLGKKNRAFVWPVRYATAGIAAAKPYLQTSSGKMPPKKTDGNSFGQRIATKYTVIYYNTLLDLNNFNNHIKYPTEALDPKRLLDSGDSKVLEGRTEKKVDALYERVQEILGIRKQLDKVAIYIFHNNVSLNHAIHRISKKEERLRSWYDHQGNALYLNANDLSERMLAHDMALSIIYLHLNLPPSQATAKILARHVARNLLQ